MATPVDRLIAAGDTLTVEVVSSFPFYIPTWTLATLPTPLSMITRSGHRFALYPIVNANMNAHIYSGGEPSTSLVIASVETVGCISTARMSPNVNIVTEVGLLTHNRDRARRETNIARVSGAHIFGGGAIHLAGPADSVEYWKAAVHTANVLKAKGQWIETQATREWKMQQINERGRPERNAARAAAAAAGAGGDSDSD
jgi:hypothetical protein